MILEVCKKVIKYIYLVNLLKLDSLSYQKQTYNSKLTFRDVILHSMHIYLTWTIYRCQVCYRSITAIPCRFLNLSLCILQLYIYIQCWMEIFNKGSCTSWVIVHYTIHKKAPTSKKKYLELQSGIPCHHFPLWGSNIEIKISHIPDPSTGNHLHLIVVLKK